MLLPGATEEACIAFSMRTIRHVVLSASLFITIAGCGGKHHHDVGQPGVVPVTLTVTGAGSALTRITTGNEDEWRPVLSNDLHMLLFEVDTVTQADVYGAQPVVHRAIVGVNPNSPNARTLLTPPNANAGFPSWMPDSHGFVYSGDSMGPLAILRTLSDTPGSAVTMVVGNQMAANPSQPAASPSGKYVAFSTQMRGATWNLAVVGVDGSHLTVLGEGAMPAWSPDEKKVAFVRSVSGQNQLFLMNPLTGGELVQITNEGGNGGPAFSPDGRKIVFSSNRQGSGWNLYSVALDGTGLTKLTNGEGSALRPHWGKDGWIYFDWAATADGTGTSDIWRFMPVGDATTPVPGAPANAGGLPPSSPPGTPSSPPGTPSFPPPSTALPPSSPPGGASPPTSALPPQYPAPKKPKGKK